MTRKKFQAILREILITDAGFTGLGAKDILIYIFGVPLTALLIKQRLFPRVVPNELFIPGVTSATVFALAKLNKIWENCICLFLFVSYNVHCPWFISCISKDASNHRGKRRNKKCFGILKCYIIHQVLVFAMNASSMFQKWCIGPKRW